MENSLVYSYTEGSVIAAKLNHREGDAEYVRMGISFPMDRSKYASSFKPSEDYLSHEILETLTEISSLVDEERAFRVSKTNVCYGNSLNMMGKDKCVMGMFLMNEPINEDSCLSLNGLGNVCDSLAKENQEVALYRDSGSYLSARMGASHLSNKFVSNLDVLDIKIPSDSLGCRVEFILPKESYDIGKIEKPFNEVAYFAKFGKKLDELEKLHEDFIKIKDSYRGKSKIAMTVKV
jgi:hypothetical protein